jgi:adenylate kinase family enzyme
MKPKRIAVIGINASGKSTFARELAGRTGLPLFHIDNLYWKGKWEAVPEAEYLKAEEELIKKEEWIIEGYIDEKEIDRLKRADLVIYLDYSGILVSFRVLRRWWNHRKVARPELSREALDSFSFLNLWVALMRKERPAIEGVLRQTDQAKVIRVHSPKALRKMIEKKT